MNYKKQFFCTAFLVGVLLPFSYTEAQRNVSYPELVQKQQQQSETFFDITVLPGDTDTTLQLVSFFSLSYDFLPFKKATGASQNAFTSNVELSLEIFESDESDLENNNVSVEGLRPIERAFWKETARAEDYQQSTSKQEFLKGHLVIPLPTGTYNYLYELDRGENADSEISSVRTIQIKPYQEMAPANIILADEISADSENPEISLFAMGNNIPFGEDFHALIFVPDYEATAKYILQVTPRSTGNDTDNAKSPIYTQNLNKEDIYTDKLPRISSNGDPEIQLDSSEGGHTFALVHVPASEFENSSYRLTLHKSEGGPAVAQDSFSTYWLDIPASLLNLDVAIDMLHFIVDDNTLSDISSGSKQEREQKFKQFWDERDPTPETAYNELMEEYYRRIDYAYKNFTTENNIGYESDQGEIYIKYGTPDDIQRKYPSDGPTTEIWKYPSRQFVFEATTGFGDFKLVSN